MRTHKIAAIPGDGIGIEVINEGIRVLQVLADRSGDFQIVLTNFPWGSDYYLSLIHISEPTRPYAISECG